MDNLEVESIVAGGLFGLIVACLAIWLGTTVVKRKLLSELQTPVAAEPTPQDPVVPEKPVLVVPESTTYVDPRTHLASPIRSQVATERPPRPSPPGRGQAGPAEKTALIETTARPNTTASAENSAAVQQRVSAAADTLQIAMSGQQRAEVERDRVSRQAADLSREVKLLNAELRRAEIRDNEVTARWQDSERRLASSEAGLKLARREIDDIRGVVLQLSETPGGTDIIDLR